MAGREARGGAGRCAGRAAGSGNRGTGNHNAVAASRHPPRTRTILNNVSDYTTDAFVSTKTNANRIPFDLYRSSVRPSKLHPRKKPLSFGITSIGVSYTQVNIDDHLSFYKCIFWCVGLWAIGKACVEDSAYNVRRLAACRARAKTWNWLPGGYF